VAHFLLLFFDRLNNHFHICDINTHLLGIVADALEAESTCPGALILKTWKRKTKKFEP
jgi:hypothetical protein